MGSYGPEEVSEASLLNMARVVMVKINYGVSSWRKIINSIININSGTHFPKSSDYELNYCPNSEGS